MNFFAGTTIKRHKESLLKFFKLNDEIPALENAALNITNSLARCEPLTKKDCAQKHKSKSNTVKKSFRPHYYDDDDEEDSDDYDETPDDEDFPEEAETGSYRSYAPRDHEWPYDDESEDYERESWRGQDYEDEDLEPHERPGYEGDMDDWDWDAPRSHRERHAFKGAAIIYQPHKLTEERISIEIKYRFATVLQVEKDGGHTTFHKTTMSSNQAIPQNITITQDIRIIDIIIINIDLQYVQIIEHSDKLRHHGLRTSRSIQGLALSLPLCSMLPIQRAWIGQEVPTLTHQAGSLGITILRQLHLDLNRSTLS